MTSGVPTSEPRKRQVARLRQAGWAIRAIARHLDISRTTVRKLVRKSTAESVDGYEACWHTPPSGKVD